MAIIKSIQAFKNILLGRKFVILSDSKPLQHYKKTTSPADIITRWLLELSEYSFDFKHIPGKSNLIADFLSRTHFLHQSEDVVSNPKLINSNEVLPIHDHSNHVNCHHNINNINLNNNNSAQVHQVSSPETQDSSFTISLATLQSEQSKDAFISRTINQINNNKLKNKSFSICPSTNLLMHSSNITSKNADHPLKIVMPKSLQDKCISLCHFPHYGITKTYQKCSKSYYWHGMYNDILHFVNSCTVCLKSKHHNIPPAPLQNNPIPTRPGQFISLDFVGPFKNHQYLLTIIDHFSKHLSLVILNKITAMNTVKAMFDYFTVFGKPDMILTDNGTQFTANITQEFQSMLGIKIHKTSISHPQTNSVSERINTSIKSTIKALMMDGYDFQNAVKIHQSLYNSTYHSTIKCSPNQVQFGRNLSGLVDTFQPNQYRQRLDVPADHYQLIKNLNQLYQQVHKNLINFRNLQNAKQLPKAKLRSFNINDQVYIQEKNALKTIYRGPFKIIKKISPVTFKLALLQDLSAPLITVHINRIISAPPSKRDVISFPNNRPIGNTSEDTGPVLFNPGNQRASKQPIIFQSNNSSNDLSPTLNPPIFQHDQQSSSPIPVNQPVLQEDMSTHNILFPDVSLSDISSDDDSIILLDQAQPINDDPPVLDDFSNDIQNSSSTTSLPDLTNSPSMPELSPISDSQLPSPSVQSAVHDVSSSPVNITTNNHHPNINVVPKSNSSSRYCLRSRSCKNFKSKYKNVPKVKYHLRRRKQNKM